MTKHNQSLYNAVLKQENISLILADEIQIHNSSRCLKPFAG